MTLVDKSAAPHGAALARADDDGETRQVAAVWTLLAAVVYGCVAHGGFRPVEQRVLFAGVAAAAVVACWTAARSRRAWRAPVLLAAPLAVWSLLAAAVGGDLAVGGPERLLALRGRQDLGDAGGVGLDVDGENDRAVHRYLRSDDLQTILALVEAEL